MTTEDLYNLAQGMEHDGAVHCLSLAVALDAISDIFGANLPEEVNSGGMSWDEVIFALYLMVYAAPDVLSLENK